MKIKLWYLLLSALFYFTVTFEGTELISYLVFYGVPLMYICLNLKYVKRIVNTILHSPIKYFVVCYVLLFLLALILPVVQRTFDFSYLSNQIFAFPKEAIRILFLLIVFWKYVSPDGDYKLYIKYYLLSCCLYVAFTGILLICPDLKMFLYNVIKESEHSKAVALQADYVTRYGWSGFSGFEHTLKCTWGVCLSLFLIVDNIKSKNIDLYVICAVMLIGNLFYGRSGFLVSICILFVFVMILLKKQVKIFTFLVVAALLAAGLLGIAAILNSEVRVWFEWAFALFINFFEEGRIGTTSTDILLNNMFFMPELKTILFGDGMYTGTDGLYYLNTDVGFMRTLLFGGIIFLIVRYLMMTGLLCGFVHYKSVNLKKLSKYFVVVAFVIILVLFELKGEIVITSINIMFGIVVAMYYGGSTRQESRLGEK